MAKLEIKYRTEGKALPPRPIRVSLPGWGGSPDLKKENGSQPQPWHCPLHVEGATSGFELLYQYENEARIENHGGKIVVVWDRAGEPGGATDDFTLGLPPPTENYLFATSLDIQAPPGYVLRTQPHPRFFADMTGTVPAALYGHVHSEWWPKKLFIVFKIPAPGQHHVFRKGEPYAQITFVRADDDFQIKPMTPDEEQRRKKLEADIKLSKSLMARHVWHSAGGIEFNDHYKVLERAFDRGGVEGVEAAVREGVEKYYATVPPGKTTAEYFALSLRYQTEGRRTEAKEVLHHLMRTQPKNPEVFHRIALLEWDIGIREEAVDSLTRAATMEPRVPAYHANLGKMLAELGRHAEAEICFRNALGINRNDPESLGLLGVSLAQRGAFDEAVACCRAALGMNPRSPASHFRAGEVLAKQGNRDEARRFYETALALDPGYAPAREALQSAAQESSPPAAG